MNTIKIDFAQKTHAPKAVNAVNNGPICNQGVVDLSRHYKALNIPAVRLHDTDGANSRFLVDVSRIFPYFDADENDSANYTFEFTDLLIGHLMKAGCEPFFRLGVTIENRWDLRL